MREQPFLDQILDAAGHKWRAAVLILRRQFLPEPCHGAIEVMQGRRLRQGLLDTSNTASGVWADTAYRSAANETFLTKNGFVSHIHRKKPKGRAMPETTRRANNAKSKIRSRVEHVFAEQKDLMGLFIRTIGIARATPIRNGQSGLHFSDPARSERFSANETSE